MQCRMVSGKYLIAFDLCPHRDCRASVWLQDAMHLSQSIWPIGEKLQPLLTKHDVECAAWGCQWCGWRFHIFNPGGACDLRFGSGNVQHRQRDIGCNDAALRTESYRSEACDCSRSGGNIEDSFSGLKIDLVKQRFC